MASHCRRRCVCRGNVIVTTPVSPTATCPAIRSWTQHFAWKRSPHSDEIASCSHGMSIDGSPLRDLQLSLDGDGHHQESSSGPSFYCRPGMPGPRCNGRNRWQTQLQLLPAADTSSPVSHRDGGCFSLLPHAVAKPGPRFRM